ncbi:MAG: hypothetical protein HOB84_06405 [Candidatus Marinimicrobia bacterium]|nr:hypothetical protein [Candidatus Neomarinimicrobiota bacterium]MBT4361862.1 hypothetical protein [Candidatus Neomarinimicrobiota bacterium]MBT4714382.1 hypothetical protein [Candidatus Neomarinimicrobiota bacterium]MBT4946083.1 hypothetical protein [Candidatus Neomarinimicrobiota bacterium]MBT5268882.1 hypothetical protein [Candidatus Neomarinimicrobiota bacterium]
MNYRKGARLTAIAMVLNIFMLGSVAFGQYSVGQTITQATRDKVVSFCANDAGNVTLGSLLVPEQGGATRVVWLNFFESW